MKNREFEFVIKLPPITKKNHQQIFRKKGKPFISQSEQYKKYEEDAAAFLQDLGIEYPVNVKAVYYMPTKRIVDKTNLESALMDVLVKAKVLKDDNSKIVVATDGSRVAYDKDNPRTEVTITEVM